MSRPVVGGGEDLDAELLAREVAEVVAHLAVEDALHVLGVPDDVSRAQDVERRHLLGEVRRRKQRHLEVAALNCRQLGTLREECAAEVSFKLEVVTEGGRKPLRHRLRPRDVGRRHVREEESDRFLRDGGRRGGEHQGSKRDSDVMSVLPFLSLSSVHASKRCSGRPWPAPSTASSAPASGSLESAAGKRNLVALVT